MGSVFSGIGEAEIFDRGNYLTAGGMYELEVRKVILKETQSSGLAFIVEFTVLSSTVEKHAVGSKATWFQKMTDRKVALPAIKELFIPLLKIDMTDPEAKEEFNSTLEELLDEMTSWEPESGEEHPLAGERVNVETFSKLTKKGLDFTAHIWSEAS